jgi:hypothetical protein
MPEHVRAKNLGLVKPVPVITPQMHGRLMIERSLNGGLLFKITGPRGTYGVELSPKQAGTVGYKILYALGHPPIVPPPGFEVDDT